MDLKEVIQVAAAILLSLGGGGIIVFGLSSWLGKVWAERILSSEKARFEREMAALQNELRLNAEKQLADVHSALAVHRETFLKHHGDKIAIYRKATDFVTATIHEFELFTLGIQAQVSPEVVKRFHFERLQVYGYLGMLAPQDVMDKFDAMIELMLVFIVDKEPVAWLDIRNTALALLNAIRADLGVVGPGIEYRGKR